MVDQWSDIYSPFKNVTPMLSLLDKTQRYIYNPFRGNCLGFGYIKNQPYLLTPSSKNLHVLNVTSFSYDSVLLTDKSSSWTTDPLPVSDVAQRLSIHVGPIQQIVVSNAPDLPKNTIIVGVRTISRLMIYGIKRSATGTLGYDQLYQFDNFETSSGSMQLVHLCLSPYTYQHFTFVLENGEFMVADLSSMNQPLLQSDTYLFKGQINQGLLTSTTSKQHVSERWKTCVYGPNSRSLVLASPRGIELVNFREPDQPMRTLIYKCPIKTRVFTLAALDQPFSFQICASTDESILLFDLRYPCQPVLAWDHASVDRPPLFLQMTPDQHQPKKVHLYAWSTVHTEMLYAQYQFDGSLQLE
ncbi:hypothetical protein DM01DRAFT_1170162 [Hesseltinella vesiculosa]|uniref:RRN6 beta-propeller domain-containing protein n=1 Tax=Hesseltinella vesiculosa TaxID=101127 RepID=A0A1X2G6T6_9FUNG|nr:hypothetical protein DM01DRAFT_1170162 [Hesseltinella vesiculosa]